MDELMGWARCHPCVSAEYDDTSLPSLASRATAALASPGDEQRSPLPS